MNPLRSPVANLMRVQKAKRYQSPSSGHSRRVTYGKRFLLGLIVGVVVVIAWSSSNNTGSDKSRVVFSNVQLSENLETEMIRPHYQGLDSKNNPYTVTADKAVQKNSNVVVLTNVSADMLQADGRWLALNAGTGEMNTKTNSMLLTDGVSVFYEGGYEFRTDYAQVDITQGTAYGDAAVQGQGPVGTLQAEGFIIEQRGAVIRFNKSVRMKLYR